MENPVPQTSEPVTVQWASFFKKHVYLIILTLIALLAIIGTCIYIKKDKLIDAGAEANIQSKTSASSTISTENSGNRNDAALDGQYDQNSVTEEKIVNKKYGYSYTLYKPVSNEAKYTFGVYQVYDWQYEELEVTNKTAKEYANALWLDRQNDKKYPNVSVSDLETIKIDGKEAYRFEVTSFMGGTQNMIIIAENDVHTVFMITYPSKSQLGQKSAETLVLDSGLITKKSPPDAWKSIESVAYGFSFSYPSNILSERNISDVEAEYGSVFNGNGDRGTMSVKVNRNKLDPNKIPTREGPVASSDTVSVGDRIGYVTWWGDGGCGTRYIHSALTSSSTLVVSFTSCNEDLYEIKDDIDLQNEIFKTFKFTK